MNCKSKGSTVIAYPAAHKSSSPPVIAAVIPCYKVSQRILEVIKRFGPECAQIYVVDDCCPENSGHFVQQHCTDPRVRVLYNSCNLGVGGAVMTGYRAAIANGAEVIVKVDGDGQMDPRLLKQFVTPILEGQADYTKGNRFYSLTNIKDMPPVRIFGNAILSFMAKLSTGYWNIFDPTNGYTAIHAKAAKRLSFDKISRRYFFETDMLFRLNTFRAVVVDIPMDSVYDNEVSNLRISRVLGDFFYKHICNFIKRIFYNYFLRDVNLASIELVIGVMMVFFGVGYGGYNWITATQKGIATPAGTVMVAALPVLLGLQLVLAFLSYDISSIPKRPIHRDLSDMS